MTQHKGVSNDTANAIDEEIRQFIDRNYERAAKLLEENKDKLHVMAETLLQYETIDVGQIDDIMNGKPPGPPADWSDDSDDKKGGAKKASKDADETSDVEAKNTSSTKKKKDGNIGGPASLH